MTALKRPYAGTRRCGLSAGDVVKCRYTKGGRWPLESLRRCVLSI